jgi:hypothetical protein
VAKYLALKELILDYYDTFDHPIPTTLERMPPYVLVRLLKQWWHLEVSQQSIDLIPRWN